MNAQGILDDLARTVCMVRVDAAIYIDEGRNEKRWWGTCEHCQKVGWLQWSHMFTRGAFSVRWDLDNFFAWCAGCHRMLDQYPERKRDWVIAKIGEERFDALKLRSNGGRPDYRVVGRMLREWLEARGVEC